MPKKIAENLFVFLGEWYLIWLRYIVSIKQIMLIIGSQYVNKKT